ncbi:MAG: PIN domain-containing protein [Bacteroidota bacterium]|nr:PIN domain-containing protein [Bacteroidota bacterium]
MNENIIVDTSIWIDFYNGISNEGVEILKSIMLSDDIVIPAIIVQEILQGIKEKKLLSFVEDSLLGFQFFNYDMYEAAFEAAALYRLLRTKGVTVRSSNDCSIAWLCISNNFPILHNDKDFDNIAKHTSLKIYKPEK